MKDLYEVLDVNKTASQEEIKSAFVKKAKENHPDKNIGKEEDFAGKMAVINEAYNVLSDPTSRDRYDKTGQKKEVPFDIKFKALINNMLGSILEQVDVDFSNVVEIFKDTVDTIVLDNENALKDLEKKLRKAENIKKRLSTTKDTNVMEVIEFHIYEFNKKIRTAKDDIEFFNTAQTVLSDYNYDFEKMNNSPRPGGFLLQEYLKNNP